MVQTIVPISAAAFLHTNGSRCMSWPGLCIEAQVEAQDKFSAFIMISMVEAIPVPGISPIEKSLRTVNRCLLLQVKVMLRIEINVI
jgi:hypothetical protein